MRVDKDCALANSEEVNVECSVAEQEPKSRRRKICEAARSQSQIHDSNRDADRTIFLNLNDLHTKSQSWLHVTEPSVPPACIVGESAKNMTHELLHNVTH